MRRRWNRMLLVALIASIAFFYPLLAPTPHRIDQAHADLIVRGMTKEQAEAIFGVPAGQYDWAEDGGRERYLIYLGLLELHRTRLDAKLRKALVAQDDGANEVVLSALSRVQQLPKTGFVWTSRHGSFMVWFDENERVISTRVWSDVRVVPPWQRWWSRHWKK